jgi:hypothetical protein
MLIDNLYITCSTSLTDPNHRITIWIANQRNLFSITRTTTILSYNFFYRPPTDSKNPRTNMNGNHERGPHQRTLEQTWMAIMRGGRIKEPSNKHEWQSWEGAASKNPRTNMNGNHERGPHQRNLEQTWMAIMRGGRIKETSNKHEWQSWEGAAQKESRSRHERQPCEDTASTRLDPTQGKTLQGGKRNHQDNHTACHTTGNPHENVEEGPWHHQTRPPQHSSPHRMPDIAIYHLKKV